MTLEEAIKRCEEVAESIDAGIENAEIAGFAINYFECEESASEHRQLAEWLKELKERRERMDRLDDAISNVAYILDTLRAYRNIVDSGDCNRCGKEKGCEYVPKPGQLVRYNCPFYKESGEGE